MAPSDVILLALKGDLEKQKWNCTLFRLFLFTLFLFIISLLSVRTLRQKMQQQPLVPNYSYIWTSSRNSSSSTRVIKNTKISHLLNVASSGKVFHKKIKLSILPQHYAVRMQ